jgi:hypothetical protein
MTLSKELFLAMGMVLRFAITLKLMLGIHNRSASR